MTDSTPAACRSPLEHERDAGIDEPPRLIWAAPDDIEGWARLGRWNVEPAWREGDVAYIRDDQAEADCAALRARLAEAEAERDRLRAVWWHQMQSEAMKEMLATALALDEWKARAEAAEAKAQKLTDQLDYAIHRYEMSGNVTELVERARSIVAKAMDERAKGGD
jgi:hypothetical protein